jgi:hypothetical protein
MYIYTCVARGVFVCKRELLGEGKREKGMGKRILVEEIETQLKHRQDKR